MAEEEPLSRKHKYMILLQGYQIIAQTVLGIVGVTGYILILYVVITKDGEWSQFQQIAISGAMGFLAGTIVSGIYGYVFGSSFGSMSKDALLQAKPTPPIEEQKP